MDILILGNKRKLEGYKCKQELLDIFMIGNSHPQECLIIIPSVSGIK